ncbi:MAG TPA: carboxypeptidase-like regulatory domain-containing protein, partial [Blastocatellia bacterium]|nr:carboxypeptidase-like regulatory domain-containing protein [Blastocatellia bacterium]
QVLPRSSDDFYPNARIDLQHESVRLATTANDLGEFRFDNMPSGEMRLEITFPHYHVVGYFMVHDVQSRPVIEEGFKNTA